MLLMVLLLVQFRNNFIENATHPAINHLGVFQTLCNGRTKTVISADKPAAKDTMCQHIISKTTERQDLRCIIRPVHCGSDIATFLFSGLRRSGGRRLGRLCRSGVGVWAGFAGAGGVVGLGSLATAVLGAEAGLAAGYFARIWFIAWLASWLPLAAPSRLS